MYIVSALSSQTNCSTQFYISGEFVLCHVSVSFRSDADIVRSMWQLTNILYIVMMPPCVHCPSGLVDISDNAATSTTGTYCYEAYVALIDTFVNKNQWNAGEVESSDYQQEKDVELKMCKCGMKY